MTRKKRQQFHSLAIEAEPLELMCEEVRERDTSFVDTPVDRLLADELSTFRADNPHAKRSEELDFLIGLCKEKLKECVSNDDGDGKREYMEKLVQLGLERQSESEVDVDSILRCKGHEFVVQPTRGRNNPCCEVCSHTIWRLVQTWRRCSGCGLRAHDKCANEVQRVCSASVASRTDFFLNTTMVGERGLSAQNFECAECRAPLAYESTAACEPRLCEYSGLLYCPSCHWNDQLPIPARIVHNLDASVRPVSRAAKSLLLCIQHRPLIDIAQFHSSLLKCNRSLRRMQQLRQNFLFMKCYFISCRFARKLRILQYLNQHQHFVEECNLFTTNELTKLCSGELLRDIEDIHTVFARHIEHECEICRGNGFYCELCDDAKMREQLLFPFSADVSMCGECMAVYHTGCFDKKSRHCPRCERRRRRVPELMPTESD